MQQHHNKLRTDYTRAFKVLAKTNPKLASSILSKTTPSHTDPSEIQPIYSAFKLTDPASDPSMARIVFVAVVLKLYSPATLITNEWQTPKMIGRELSKCLGLPGISSTSRIVAQARAYMKLPFFQEKVETVLKEVV